MEPKKQVGRRQRIKDNRFPMVATTLEGLEDVLAEELTAIGGNDVRIGKRAVTFTADQDLVYKANLRLRTALRVLKPLARFQAEDDESLYRQTKDIDWTALFDGDKTFVIKSAVTGSVFTHSHYASLKCKDAIVDLFREKTGKRPSIDTLNADVVVHLRIYEDRVNLSLDSSGEPLSRRGYRQPEAVAPLNECLAAGMLLMAGYNGRVDFVDGMCGSGTLCIEAAMIAHRIAPGLMRDQFSFMHWKDYDPDLFEIIRDATVNRLKEEPVRIFGYDTSMGAVRSARKAAQAAGLDEAIDFRVADFFEEKPPAPPAFLVMNPPYDERMSVDNVEEFYQKIGDKLKADYTGYKAWIISGHQEAMKRIGLRTFATHHLLNGSISCRYSGYRMFSGKKAEQPPQG